MSQNHERLKPAQKLEIEELQARILPQLERCIRAGQYLIAIVTCESETLSVEGTTGEFPVAQFDAAAELLLQNLQLERERVESANSEV